MQVLGSVRCAHQVGPLGDDRPELVAVRDPCRGEVLVPHEMRMTSAFGTVSLRVPKT